MVAEQGSKQTTVGLEAKHSAACKTCCGLIIYTHQLKNGGYGPVCLGISKARRGELLEEEVDRSSPPDVGEDDSFLHLGAGYSVSSRAMAREGYMPVMRYGGTFIMHGRAVPEEPSETTPAAPAVAAAAVAAQQHAQVVAVRRASAVAARQHDGAAADAFAVTTAFAVRSGEALAAQARSVGAFWGRALAGFPGNFKSVAQREVEQMYILPARSADFARKWYDSVMDIELEDREERC